VRVKYWNGILSSKNDDLMRVLELPFDKDHVLQEEFVAGVLGISV